MSNICIVASCDTRKRNTNKTTAVKCFSFPKDHDLKNQWLHLCQVKEDSNRKVCIKHFKEDDFIDGLKARLMGVQPTRLKKNAVPSLFLNIQTTEEIKQKQTTAKNQEQMLEKYICKKERRLRISKVIIPNPTKGSTAYLSKLVPIAPKGQAERRMIVPAKHSSSTSNDALLPNVLNQSVLVPKKSPKGLIAAPDIEKKELKFVEHNTMRQVQVGFSSPQLKILQHDNAIYKKRINTLLESQNKLMARIKELETKIEGHKVDFVSKVKETFAHVLTSNQVDYILGKKKHIWWTNEEYSKAIKLLHISKHAYKYVREQIKYPFPGASNVLKWAMNHGQLETDNNIQKCDDNKENGGKVVNDDMMLDNDVKPEIKNEYDDVDMKIVNIEYDQGYDDTTKVHNDSLDQCNIEYEKVDYVDNALSKSDENYVIDDSNDGDDVERNFAEECSNLEFNINENIDECDRSMDDDNQNEEFYEELIIENDYSDDVMFDVLQNTECVEKENG